MELSIAEATRLARTPEFFDDDTLEVTRIGSNAYANRDISAVILESYVNFIGTRAFFDCSGLRNVAFSNHTSLTLGDRAFSGCIQLQNVAFSNNTSLTLGDYSFAGCTALSSISLPDFVSIIPISCFNKTNISSVDLKNVEHIRERAFYNSPISFLNIPFGLKSISSEAFKQFINNDKTRDTRALNTIVFENPINNPDAYYSLDISNDAFGALANLTNNDKLIIWNCPDYIRYENS